MSSVLSLYLHTYEAVFSPLVGIVSQLILYLDSNIMTPLQCVQHLVQLEQLFMGHNQLLNIPCIKNTHLAVLNLCYNRIESLQGEYVMGLPVVALTTSGCWFQDSKD